MASRDAESDSGPPDSESRWAQYWQMRAPYDAAIRELQMGDGGSIGLVLRYLTQRPRFVQSGYIAEKMLRFADRVALSESDRVQLIRLANNIVSQGPSREAHQAALLLRRLDSKPVDKGS